MKIYSVPENDTFGAKAKAWVKNRAVDAKDIWQNNQKEILVLAPIVQTIIASVSKSVNKSINAYQETMLKDRRIYDTSLGHYWELKRKLSNSDYLEIEHRRRNVEILGDILKEMRVLK